MTLNVAIGNGSWYPVSGVAPTITYPSSLPDGTVNSAYTPITFTATGTLPITWSITSGTLPADMTFSSGGVLSGTPTETSTGSITFTATNSAGSASRPLTFTIVAATGPVLITAPVVKVYRGTANAVGTIYTFDRAVWENESGLQYTGTIQTGDLVAPNQLYIGASPIQPVSGQRWFITTTKGSPYDATTGKTSEITSYNSVTKIATVNWPNDGLSPPVGTTWYLIYGYPLVRAYQWQRNGVDIPGQIDVIYTSVALDLGKSITLKEQAGRISPENNGRVLETPVLSTTVSAGYSITVSGSDYSSADDFTYLGSFKSGGRYHFDSQGSSVTLVSAANAYNSQKSIIFKAPTGYYSSAVEFNIPSPLSTNYSTLPLVTVTSPYNSTLGNNFWPLIGGLTAPDFGIQTGVGYTQYGGVQIAGTANMLINQAGSYSYQDSGNALFWRRPIDISVNTYEGPFVPIDTASNLLNSRWFAGSIVNIPEDAQSALGGDILLSSGGLSIHANNSQGPACMRITNASITAAMAKRLDGTARGGTANTMQLATDASSTAYFYVGCYVYCPSFNEPSDQKSIYRITAYDSSTKTITVNQNFASTVSSSTTYKIYPNLEGKILSGYPDGSPLATQQANGFSPEWNGIVSDVYSMFFPRNSGLVIFIATPIIGYGDYGIHGAPSADDRKRLIYDPYNQNSSPSNRVVGYYLIPSSTTSPMRVMVYSVTDLASVASGSMVFSSIKPKALYSLPIPFKWMETRQFSFDNDTGKLYISQRDNLNAPDQFDVFSVMSFSKWS